MKRPPRRLPLARCPWSVAAFGASALMLAMGSCKDEDKDETAQKQSEDAANSKAEAQAKKDEPGPAAPRSVTPAKRLGERGGVLAHVLLPNTSNFLEEVQAQASAPQVAMFVTEDFLRNAAAGQLGERSAVADNVRLSQPIGCAVLDPKKYSFPAACHLQYQGGLKQLLQDLGDKGKQADAGDHAAHYRIQGNEIYIDELGDAIVITGHTKAFANAKSYLQTNLLGRTDEVSTDIELVAYPTAIMDRYRDELKPIIEETTKVQPIEPTGDPKLDEVLALWSRYNAQSTKNTIENLGEMDQITGGLGLETTGLVVSWAVFPVEDSKLQQQTEALTAGPLQQEPLGELPDSAWLLFGSRTDREASWNTESYREVEPVLVESYAKLTGKNKAEVQKALEQYQAESNALYDDQNIYALVHEPDTLGGFVWMVPMKSGKSGRESWKQWSQAFTPENVLSKDLRQYLNWSFEPDATEVGEVPVDRWTIEPSAETLEAVLGEAVRESLRAKTRGEQIVFVVDRAEKDQKTVYTVTVGPQPQTMKAALAALDGTDALAGSAGLAKLREQYQGVSSLAALDGKGAIDWIRAIAPEDATANIPADLGKGLGDVVFASSTGKGGVQTGELMIAQRLLDQLRALGQTKPTN